MTSGRRIVPPMRRSKKLSTWATSFRTQTLPSDRTFTSSAMLASGPVSAVADYTEVRDVRRVSIRQEKEISLRLLFDPEHNLEERILNEQFVP